MRKSVTRTELVVNSICVLSWRRLKRLFFGWLKCAFLVAAKHCNGGRTSSVRNDVDTRSRQHKKRFHIHAWVHRLHQKMCFNRMSKISGKKWRWNEQKKVATIVAKNETTFSMLKHLNSDAKLIILMECNRKNRNYARMHRIDFNSFATVCLCRCRWVEAN